MDYQTTQQPTQQHQVLNLQKKRISRTLLLSTGILILGFITGFTTRSFIYQQKNTQQITQQPIPNTLKLPVSLSLLTNPIVYEWRGSVVGKLTQKNAHDFTLTDDRGNNIKITDTPLNGSRWKINFFDKNNKDKAASYSAIPLGSTLRGEFFIFKNNPSTPVGSLFIKQ